MPDCGTRAHDHPLCHQHRHTVGWRLAADFQTQYRQRFLQPHRYEAVKTEVFNKLKESKRANSDQKTR